MNDDTSVFVGSGNVFADLGLPDPEERLLKAQIVATIQDLLTERHMTDAQVGVLFDISETDAKQMLDGRLAGFPVSHLLRCLNRLGRRVEVRVLAQDDAPKAASPSAAAA